MSGRLHAGLACGEVTPSAVDARAGGLAASTLPGGGRSVPVFPLASSMLTVILKDVPSCLFPITTKNVVIVIYVIITFDCDGEYSCLDCNSHFRANS